MNAARRHENKPTGKENTDMLAIIDCGTTNTRVYIVDQAGSVIAQSARRVGVRNTSMTGSKDTLRDGVVEAIQEALQLAGLEERDIEFAIASGMITSEIGLLEIPHLVAPVGLEDLAANVRLAAAGEILPLQIPILFIRGVRNNYGSSATLADIRKVDFMRGEETQMIGIIDDLQITEPTNVIVLSSHTKIIHLGADHRIHASLTTISGQLYEAVLKETMIGQSLYEKSGEQSGGYSFEEIVAIASQVTEETGLDRCLMIPRFMQVLLTTDYKERNLFIDASIAVDDMKCISDFERQGYFARTFILFGHPNRCALYTHLLNRKYGDDIHIVSLSDKEKLSQLTIRGAVTIADRYRERTSSHA